MIAHDKSGRSAASLSQELGISYKTAWLMLHKIRKAMANRDSQYILGGIVEVDDAFFGAPTEGGLRGRGTDIKKETIVKFVNSSIQTGSTISSDAYRSYTQLAKEGYEHKPKVFNPKENPDHLKWLHTIISNAKAFIAGTFHGLDRKHLQAYLNEFCYRFNRRNFKSELFNRLLNVYLSTKAITYTELTV